MRYAIQGFFPPLLLSPLPMGFGKHFQSSIVEAWRPHYIDYASLRLRLRDVMGQKMDASRAWQDALDVEIERIRRFYVSTATSLEVRLSSSTTATEKYDETTLRGVSADVIRLVDYATYNTKAILHLLEKYDRTRPGETLGRLYAWRFSREPVFSSTLIEHLLSILSDAYRAGLETSCTPTIERRRGGKKPCIAYLIDQSLYMVFVILYLV